MSADAVRRDVKVVQSFKARLCAAVRGCSVTPVSSCPGGPRLKPGHFCLAEKQPPPGSIQESAPARKPCPVPGMVPDVGPHTEYETFSRGYLGVAAFPPLGVLIRQRSLVPRHGDWQAGLC